MQIEYGDTSLLRIFYEYSRVNLTFEVKIISDIYTISTTLTWLITSFLFVKHQRLHPLNCKIITAFNVFFELYEKITKKLGKMAFYLCWLLIHEPLYKMGA